MRTTIVIAMMALLAGVASAATVTFTITYGGGNFTVDATVNAAVGNGLTFFKLDMDPATTTTLTNTSSQGLILDAINSVTFGVAFNQSRGPTGSFPMQLAGGMDPGTRAVYKMPGVGIVSVPFPAADPGDVYVVGPLGDPIPMPANLGSGTYTGAMPALDATKIMQANVYDLVGGILEVPLADIDVVFVPEPATMGMLAIGGLGILLRRRR